MKVKSIQSVRVQDPTDRTKKFRSAGHGAFAGSGDDLGLIFGTSNFVTAQDGSVRKTFVLRGLDFIPIRRDDSVTFAIFV